MKTYIIRVIGMFYGEMDISIAVVENKEKVMEMLSKEEKQRLWSVLEIPQNTREHMYYHEGCRM